LPTIEGSYDEGKREFAITPSDIGTYAGTYKKYKVDGAACTVKDYTIRRGDYLMADGHLLPKATALTEEQKAKVAAIVFWTPAETDPAGRLAPASLADDRIMARDFPQLSAAYSGNTTQTLIRRMCMPSKKQAAPSPLPPATSPFTLTKTRANGES